MRTCHACGFENAEPGKPCALCGASEGPPPQDQLATLELPATRLAGPRPVIAGAALQAGEVYAERYHVEALLGSGGMGQVYRVRDSAGGGVLALKILHPLLEQDEERVERFRREIGILAKIEHAAVPRIHGWGHNGEELYFVSELIDGRDLKREIEARGPWPAEAAAALVATVADALAAAHGLGIVHRDVKPSNIMLDADGSVRLLDFGLARGRGVDLATLTRTGMVVGTPGYMSPEQFDGRGVDERSDVYSLGVVLFELLTARLPFTGTTPIAVAMSHKTEAPPSPRSLRPEMPAWLDRTVLRCLAKEPMQRFATAAALALELRRSRSAPRSRRLASGDSVVEDESESTDWALVLAAPVEKTGWSQGMALRYQERYYRLDDAESTDASGWIYRFGHWREGEVFRRLIDYEQDCQQRRSAREARLSSRLQRWLSGRRGFGDRGD
jgi:serine/threonine protein kinase